MCCTVRPCTLYSEAVETAAAVACYSEATWPKINDPRPTRPTRFPSAAAADSSRVRVCECTRVRVCAPVCVRISCVRTCGDSNPLSRNSIVCVCVCWRRALREDDRYACSGDAIFCAVLKPSEEANSRDSRGLLICGPGEAKRTNSRPIPN